MSQTLTPDQARESTPRTSDLEYGIADNMRSRWKNGWRAFDPENVEGRRQLAELAATTGTLHLRREYAAQAAELAAAREKAALLARAVAAVAANPSLAPGAYAQTAPELARILAAALAACAAPL